MKTLTDRRRPTSSLPPVPSAVFTCVLLLLFLFSPTPTAGAGPDDAAPVPPTAPKVPDAPPPALDAPQTPAPAPERPPRSSGSPAADTPRPVQKPTAPPDWAPAVVVEVKRRVRSSAGPSVRAPVEPTAQQPVPVPVPEPSPATEMPPQPTPPPRGAAPEDPWLPGGPMDEGEARFTPPTVFDPTLGEQPATEPVRAPSPLPDPEPCPTPFVVEEAPRPVGPPVRSGPMPSPPRPPTWDPGRDMKIRIEPDGRRVVVAADAAPVRSPPSRGFEPLPVPGAGFDPGTPSIEPGASWVPGVPTPTTPQPMPPGVEPPAPQPTTPAIEPGTPWVPGVPDASTPTAVQPLPPSIEPTTPRRTAPTMDPGNPWVPGVPDGTVPSVPQPMPPTFEPTVPQPMPPTVEPTAPQPVPPTVDPESPWVAGPGPALPPSPPTERVETPVNPRPNPEPGPMRFPESPATGAAEHARRLLASPGDRSVTGYPASLVPRADAEVALSPGHRPALLLFYDDASATSDQQAAEFLPLLVEYKDRVDIVPVDVSASNAWTPEERKLVRTYYMAVVPTTVVLYADRRPVLLKFQRIAAPALQTALDKAVGE